MLEAEAGQEQGAEDEEGDNRFPPPRRREDRMLYSARWGRKKPASREVKNE